MKADLLTTTPPNPDAIPSMGGRYIGEYLRNAARAVRAPATIVEVGTWLGSGTAHLALGAANRPDAPTIHTFDLFQARGDEVLKAGAEDIQLDHGQDTLPLVQSLIDPFGAKVEYHKGDILKTRWAHGPIGLYVDDAAKTPTTFYRVLSTFAPQWVPGETVLVLMDYRFWERQKTARGAKRFRVQQDFIERHPGCFEGITDSSFEGSCVAAFRYLKPFPMAPVHRQAKLRAGLRRLAGS